MTACVNMTRLSVATTCALMLLAFMGSCAPLRQPPASLPPVPSVPEQLPPAPPAPPVPSVPQPPVDPRHRASLQLTDQGRTLLVQKRYDDAIRTLEQAISLYPQNGESYYYMAEAWLAKNNFKLAGEFNRLAAMYLNSPHWASRVDKQQRAIDSGPLDP